MTIDTTPPSPNGESDHNDIRLKLNEVVEWTHLIDLNDEYEIKIDVQRGHLALFRITAGIEEFIGEIGGGLTDQYLFTKALGGVRFLDESTGFEEFVLQRSTTGDALGAVFGSVSTTTDGGNFFATSEAGGLTVYHRTGVGTQQQIGNPASLNFIESDFFSFQFTTDQVLPYGVLMRRFIGETDVDFVDMPFDVRVLDSTGTILWSDIQNLAVWEADPLAAATPPFLLSSNAGVVTLPMSQQFPMNSEDTYTIEYRFETAIRLKGDDPQPALSARGPRTEYYPLDYTHAVECFDSDFIGQTGGEYKIDTTGGTVTATIHPTVKSLWVGDANSTWTNANMFKIDWGGGVGTEIEFGIPENGKRYQVIEFGAGYRVYESDGALHDQVP